MLHIGNIANNAYNNAKLLNELGFDCDVLCADYYDIMASPEWEDAEFEGTITDPSLPDWRAVDLKGFTRPRWFAQGPMWACIRYLLARRRQQTRRARFWWWACSRPWRGVPKFLVLRAWWLRLMGAPRAVWLLGILFGLLLMAYLSCAVGAVLLGASASIGAWRLLGRIRRMLQERQFNFTAHRQTLIDRFKERFGDRVDSLTDDDLRVYRRVVPTMRLLFGHYDLIQGYAVDPVYPLVASKRPYVAYEHGTLRDIPFEADRRGRITALGYAEANAIYMTNADSVNQALSLQPERERVVFGIHGFDERRLRNWAARLAPGTERAHRFDIDDDTALFLAPARHHWKEGFATWRKGNDRIVRAAGLVAQRHPGRFRLVFVRWGKEVTLTEQLIDELELGEHVSWIAPLPKRELWHAYCSADCVLDQFVLPCIGGVTIEALALARCPVITHLNTEIMESFFGESPPLFNCRTPEEIAAAMETVITNPERARDVARRSKQWLESFHSHQVLQRTHLDAYETAGLFS